MRYERRYTEGQKALLSIDQSKLNEEEKDLLRRVLLPRTRYLPQSDKEGRELALQMLQQEKYDAMFALVDALKERYGALECSWARGDRVWDLYYSVRKNGQVLCRFGICLNLFNLILSFGRAECEQFEKERDSFPRDMVQWTYDMSEAVNGRKHLMFDPAVPNILPQLFRLLSMKSEPGRSKPE